MWSGKQKRAYHRAKSGVKVASILHLPIKHLVLTTSPQGSSLNLSNDFQVLRKRIYRKFNILLPYFMVHTNEGNGVLHVLYRSKQYLPQKWLSAQWNDIHLSSYVYIKQPPNDVANYIVTQYVSGQSSSYQRCSWSHSWVCKGFVKAWKCILRQTSDWKHQYWSQLHGCWCAHYQLLNALTEWDKWLTNQVIKQTTLF
jgi:hypothetical protein